METTQITELINHVDKIINDNINEIENLLSNQEVIEVCNKHKEFIETKSDLGLNIFTIVSDYYYYEKFHSQIIATLLNPNEKHNEGNKFLILFLGYLKENFKEKCSSINLDNYYNVEVRGTKEIGEKKYIDVWIKSSKHCIIIENKINNAVDQNNQIPRYFQTANDENLIVDAIIYLSLDGKKTITDKINWPEEEKKDIEKVLLEIATYSEDGKLKDLHHGWLLPCINAVTNIDALFLLRQYSKLIKHLNQNAMNYQLMEKYFELILKDNKLQTALEIQKLMSDVSSYKAYRLKNIFETKLNKSPFNSVKAVRTECSFDGFTYENQKIKLDIKDNGEVKNYVVQFYDSSYYDEGKEENKALKILHKINLDKEFYQKNEEGNDKFWFEKNFKFPEEEKMLLEFIDSLNEKLLAEKEKK
jgi:hypothetical protein